jgi:hypothetical protein
MKVPEDKVTNAFSFLGGFTHDVLEDFYKGTIDNDDMCSLFENKVFEQQIMDIRFAADDDRNDSISAKYVSCIKHFFKNYIKDDNAILEQFVYLKVGEHLFYGYVDKFHVETDANGNKTIFVDDFKTSTMYKGEKQTKEKGQLLLYSIAVSEMYKIPLSQIRARWNFAKYVSVDCEQVNGKIAVMNPERNCIVETLRAKLKTWFSKCGYSEEDFEKYFAEAKKFNEEDLIDLDCLKNIPEEVRKKFNIRDCLIEIEINDSEIEDFKKKLHDVCDEIKAKENQYQITRDDSLFWITIDSKNSFFFLSLCGYSAKHHAPLKQYFDELDAMESSRIAENNKSNEESEFLKALLGD